MRANVPRAGPPGLRAPLGPPMGYGVRVRDQARLDTALPAAATASVRRGSDESARPERPLRVYGGGRSPSWQSGLGRHPLGWSSSHQP